MRATLLMSSLTIVLSLPNMAFAQDGYDQSFARARAAEARGDLDGAVHALLPAREAFPQDYSVALAIADLLSRSGRADESVAAYRMAIARSPRAEAAHRGLIGALVSAGRCDEATMEDRVMRATVPGAAPDESLAWCGSSPARHVVLAFAFQEMLFPGHAYKSSATGGSASLDLPLGDWTVGATGRYLSLSTRDEDVVPAFAQREGYLRVGVGNRTVGGTMVLAALHDGSGALGSSYHAGVALRWSPAGDFVLAATVSAYSDETVYRLSPSYRIPLGYGVSLVPALALERAENGTYGSLALSLAWDGTSGGFFLGGKVGEEVRPAYLTDSVVYDVEEHVGAGLYVGGRISLGSHVSLRATYSFDHLLATPASGSTASGLHSLSIGPVFTF